MANDTNLPPFMKKGFDSFKDFKYPGLNMEVFLEGYQRNIELISATMKIATETTESLMELQNKYIQKAFEQWNEEIKYSMSKAPLDEKTSHQTEVAKSTVDDAIKHAQDVSSILVKTNEKIVESVQTRFKEGQEEVKDLVKTEKKTDK